MDEEHATDDDGTSSEHLSSMEAIVRLGERFRVPLEGPSVDRERLPEEFHELLVHATQFISLSTMGYQAVWWRLFHAPNATEWYNCLTLARLLLTLPVSNGKLERIFSTLKVIKVDKRSLLGNDTLDDLLVLNTDLIPLKNFNPDPSITMWWKAKTRRPNQRQRKEYKKQSNTGDQEDTSAGNLLDDWDEFTKLDES